MVIYNTHQIIYNINQIIYSINQIIYSINQITLGDMKMENIGGQPPQPARRKINN